MWLVACLWVVVALMPLRAWAWVGMGLGGGLQVAPDALVAVGDPPPCHAAQVADDTAPDDHSACSDCVFCAPVLVTSLPAMSTVMHPDSRPPAADVGRATVGALESLFRPPRG